MAGHRTERKKAFLSGTTPRIRFPILTGDSVGILPDTLTMSVYDYDDSPDPPVESIINGRNDVDIIAKCDADGNVEVYLDADDTAMDVPARETATYPKRRVLFRWTFGSDPLKVGKHEVILSIAPDRESVAV